MSEVQPLFKHKRINSPETVRKYHRDNPYCEWPGCRTPMQRTAPHHIKSVGSGGDDTPENLLTLCWIHHAEVHQGKYSRKEVERVKRGDSLSPYR